VGLGIVALFIAAVGVMVWRCEEAISRSHVVAKALGGSGLLAVRAASAEAAAASAVAQALWAGVTAVVLAVLAGAAFARYVAQLMNRIDGQEDDRHSALAQRDELFVQVRATTAVLGEVVGQIRARAGEAVAATAQMSKAVAETSATMQELAVSAGSVAANTRAAGEAAQQVEDTMRDMHQQVDGIAEGALSLGERASEIGEILELVNQFSGQTNLLALNVAIEAARAGKAGQGFAVVADEVRGLAQRSIRSTESIGAIIAAVQDGAHKMITATERGAGQAVQVGDLMHSTATMLDEAVHATQQQKSAADHVDAALQQIRAATEQLATGQQLRFAHAERLETLARDLDAALQPGVRNNNGTRLLLPGHDQPGALSRSQNNLTTAQADLQCTRNGAR
jgi:methyl-accepting chemotaxis protein